MPTKAWIEVPINQEIGDNADCSGIPYFFPPEGAIVPFFFTADSFTRVLSALINGAMLTYPNGWLQVVWDFLVNVECPMSICELIIDCIENDADVQAVLRAFVVNDEAIQDGMERIAERGIPITITEAETLIVNTVDYAALFGAITYLVDTMHNANLDLYQAFEAASNKRDLGEIVFEAIPVLETLPLDEVSEYISELETAIAENYEGQWTTVPITGLRDRIRCGLFCLALANDNSLSWELIANYFWGEVGFTFGDYVDTMQDFVTFFITGTWTGNEIVFISFANIASALSTAQKFGGMTFPGLTTIMQLGLNDPDEDYEILCTDCVEPPLETCYDFTSGEQGFIAYNNGFVDYAAFSGGNGWGVGFNPGIIKIRITDTGGTVIRVWGRFSQAVPSGINNTITAANYNQTGATAINDVETAAWEIPVVSLSSGLDVDLTFDGTLPVGFYLEEVCVEFES